MSASPPNFSILQAGTPWVNKDGTPTTYFFRLIYNIFQAAGSGTPPFLTEVADLAFSQGTRSGPDYDRQIADITTLLSSLPDPAGRIATLERRIAELEALIQEQRRTVDLNPLATRVDSLTAFSLMHALQGTT